MHAYIALSCDTARFFRVIFWHSDPIICPFKQLVPNYVGRRCRLGEDESGNSGFNS